METQGKGTSHNQRRKEEMHKKTGMPTDSKFRAPESRRKFFLPTTGRSFGVAVLGHLYPPAVDLSRFYRIRDEILPLDSAVVEHLHTVSIGRQYGHDLEGQAKVVCGCVIGKSEAHLKILAHAGQNQRIR